MRLNSRVRRVDGGRVAVSCRGRAARRAALTTALPTAPLPALLALLLALLLPVIAAGPALAGNGGITAPGGTGYIAQVSVRFSGDAAPGGGTRTVGIAPSCWWAAAAGPHTDAVQMLAWYDAVTLDLPQRVALGIYGPRQNWVDAATAAAHGTPTSWYVATCRDPADYATFNGGSAESIEPGHGPQTWVTWRFRAFPAAVGVPPPQVDPADLAKAARDVMVIPVPVVQRNPKISTAGGSTLVGLPTWFWVTDPAAVGGATGTRTIRAEVGAVWARVVATTGGLTLSSPAGGTSCSPARARVAYSPGASEASACTVQFDRASVAYPAGYPVTASTAWTATWTGSGGTGGTLNPLGRNAASEVPVAEVQTIVTP